MIKIIKFPTFKTYDGKKYKLAYIHSNKRDATRDAKERRSHDYYIRIHKSHNKYLIYYRITAKRKKRERGIGYKKW